MLYAMSKMIMVGLLNSGVYTNMLESDRRVYSEDGISPTVFTFGGGNKEIKVMINVKSATQRGYEAAEVGDYIDLKYPESATRRGRVGKGIAQTLQCDDMNAVVVPVIAGMRGRNPNNPTSRKRSEIYEQMLEIKDDGTSNCLTTFQKDNLVVEPRARIRKLTPRECWRLMDFDNEDFDKAKAAGVSDSQLYKQAGNSICVGVLEAIFRNMTT